jgi:hypothetical protein
MYTPHSRMSALDYMVEPEVKCPDSDENDVTFIHVTITIRGHDAVGKFLSAECTPWPPASALGM